MQPISGLFVAIWIQEVQAFRQAASPFLRTGTCGVLVRMWRYVGSMSTPPTLRAQGR
jgi:hypothetical protein